MALSQQVVRDITAERNLMPVKRAPSLPISHASEQVPLSNCLL